jgi:hypothetical protein
MSRHMVLRAQVPGMPAPVVDSTTWDSAGLLVGFAVSTLIFFLTTYGWVLWIAGPVVVGQVYRRRYRKLGPEST